MVYCCTLNKPVASLSTCLVELVVFNRSIAKYLLRWWVSGGSGRQPIQPFCKELVESHSGYMWPAVTPV